MTTPSVLVCVPTVPGRQAYLANCARSYERAATSAAAVNMSIVHDALSAGDGWQRCAEQGLDWFPDTTHIHFSNDDVCVARGWLDPLMEATRRACVPAMRIEPAGGHLDEIIFQTHPPMPPDYAGDVPRDPVAYFFAGLPDEQPTEDWQELDHGNLPFCSVEQWWSMDDFPPIHYGSDRWFADRARRAGYPTVARLGSVAFNYNANIGRHRGTWTEQDFAAFDGIFGLPAYLAGVLEPYQQHPLRETEEGLRWVRAWRALHESPPADPSQHRILTDAGRLEMLREWVYQVPGEKRRRL